MSAESADGTQGLPLTDLSLLITAVSATVSMRYAIQAVLTGKEVTAQYAAARSAALSLAVGAVVTRPAWRTRQVIVGLGLTIGAVQLLDAGIGLGQHNLIKTLGPAVTSRGGHRCSPGRCSSRPSQQGKELDRPLVRRRLAVRSESLPRSMPEALRRA